MTDPRTRPRRKLLIARFPGDGWEHSDCVDWYARTVAWCQQTPWLDFDSWKITSTPATMCRNAAVEAAKDARADYLLMVDSDMAPDLPGQKPFLPAALEFAMAHDGPCLVGAPYCGAPPDERVMCFRAAYEGSRVSARPTFGDFAREEAAGKTGFERVAAIGTGLLLIDLRAVERIEPPYFEYEWTDRTMSAWVSTEDVVFTRDLGFAGVPSYVAWDCWAGHWKSVLIGRPVCPPAERFPRRLAEHCRSGLRKQMQVPDLLARDWNALLRAAKARGADAVESLAGLSPDEWLATAGCDAETAGRLAAWLAELTAEA